MEVGVYHEFHCRPEQTQAAAFADALDQIEAADRWGLDAIWLAEIHQQARRSVMSAPMTVASAIAARTKRIKIGTGVQVYPSVPPAAPRRGDRDRRPDQQRPVAVRGGSGRRPAQLYGLWRALFGKPRAVSRNLGDRQAGVVAGALLLRGEILALRERLGRCQQPFQKPFPPIRVAAASEETFPSLGEAGYPIFVAVRSGSLSGLAPDLAAYRQAYREAGHPGEGEVYLRLTLHIADTDKKALDEAEESIMLGYRTLSARGSKGLPTAAPRPRRWPSARSPTTRCGATRSSSAGRNMSPTGCGN